MHPILKKHLQVEKLLQLEWRLSDDDTFEVKSLLVTRKGDDLSWNEGEIWSDQDALSKYIKKKKRPLSICFTGKGILSKTLASNTDNLQDVVAKMIPSGLENEYYISVLKGKKQVYASLIRKEKIDTILDLLSSFTILQTFIGNYALILLPELFDVNFPIEFGHIRLTKNEGENISILSLEEKSESLALGKESERIEDVFFTSLCTAAEFFYQLYPIIESFPDRISQSKKDYKYKIILDKISKPLIILLFAVFLGNFFYLSRLEAQYVDLYTHYELNKEQSEMVNKLENEIRNREELLNRSGWSTKYRISFISDQIALTVPNEIILNEMEIHPLKQSIREGVQIDFQWRKIGIEGQVNDSKALNNWIKKLNSLSFIEDVQMTNYEIERRENNAVFQLTIHTK